jgi:glycosyltransferase involved in cell wall biosynthesis
MDKPLVSIIIPTYNRADLIRETLDSVLAQTYQNWECIIVDDGSTDNTDEVVGEYVLKDQRFKYYHRPDEHLPGGNGARNYGFKMSKGEYVNWLDSDDLLINTYIKNQVKNIVSQKADVSICDLKLFSTHKSITKKWLSDAWKNSTYEEFCEGYVMFRFGITTPCFFYKKTFLKKLKLFEESLKRSQEYEFFCRIFLVHKPKYKTLNKPLVLYRQHQGNKLQELKSGQSDKVISGLLAKKMVIDYAKTSFTISSKMQDYFIADALTYLQYYKTDNVKRHVEDILNAMVVKNADWLIKRYQELSEYLGPIKLKSKEIKLLEKKLPITLLYRMIKISRKMNSFSRRIFLKINNIGTR